MIADSINQMKLNIMNRLAQKCVDFENKVVMTD
jgi:hypothetical protein